MCSIGDRKSGDDLLMLSTVKDRNSVRRQLLKMSGVLEIAEVVLTTTSSHLKIFQ